MNMTIPLNDTSGYLTYEDFFTPQEKLFTELQLGLLPGAVELSGVSDYNLIINTDLEYVNFYDRLSQIESSLPANFIKFMHSVDSMNTETYVWHWRLSSSHIIDLYLLWANHTNLVEEYVRRNKRY